jgi:3-hydroxyisobutyrate dehydrogenase
MQRHLADAARARGCRFVDAPVTGSKHAAERGELTALAGGEAEDIERVRPVLAAMTASVKHVGPNGSSASLKLGNNQIIALIAGALRESLAMCDAAGIDREAAIDMYCGTFGRVAAMKRGVMIARDWTPHFTTDALLKDLHAAARTAEAAGIEVPLLHALIPTLEDAVRQGRGRLDFSSLTDAAAPVPAGRG